MILKLKPFLIMSLLVMSMTLSACSKKSVDTAAENDSTETIVTEEQANTSEDSEKKDSEDTSFLTDVVYSEYAGEYQDSFSQRASMEIQDLGDSLKIMVHWSSSASESSIWSMTAKFTSPDKLSYTDCEYGIITFDEKGNDSYTKESDSGKGYFTLSDGKFYWDGAENISCKDCVFERTNYETQSNSNSSNSKEIRHMAETIDINNLPDGKYPVKIFFDNMKKNEGSLSLDFLIYTVVHYDPEDINNMTRDDIIYEYVDETTTKTHVIDTVNFPIDVVCVVNGGSERGEGITFTLEESGLYQISVGEGYTRTASHGMVTMEIPDSVSFEDNFNLENTRLQGAELYDYFNALGDTEKEYFNQNNTFITVSGGKIAGFNRIFLP